MAFDNDLNVTLVSMSSAKGASLGTFQMQFKRDAAGTVTELDDLTQLKDVTNEKGQSTTIGTSVYNKTTRKIRAHSSATMAKFNAATQGLDLSDSKSVDKALLNIVGVAYRSDLNVTLVSMSSARSAEEWRRIMSASPYGEVVRWGNGTDGLVGFGEVAR